jgi:hypothetical protein
MIHQYDLFGGFNEMDPDDLTTMLYHPGNPDPPNKKITNQASPAGRGFEKCR